MRRVRQRELAARQTPGHATPESSETLRAATTAGARAATTLALAFAFTLRNVSLHGVQHATTRDVEQGACWGW
eukprot:2598611-Prymnesium_polylepis.1